MKKLLQSIKCFFGFHVEGKYSRTTHRIRHIRVKHFCAVCEIEYNKSVSSTKSFGG